MCPVASLSFKPYPSSPELHSRCRHPNASPGFLRDPCCCSLKTLVAVSRYLVDRTFGQHHSTEACTEDTLCRDKWHHLLLGARSSGLSLGLTTPFT